MLLVLVVFLVYSRNCVAHCSGSIIYNVGCLANSPKGLLVYILIIIILFKMTLKSHNSVRLELFSSLYCISDTV